MVEEGNRRHVLVVYWLIQCWLYLAPRQRLPTVYNSYQGLIAGRINPQIMCSSLSRSDLSEISCCNKSVWRGINENKNYHRSCLLIFHDTAILYKISAMIIQNGKHNTWVLRWMAKWNRQTLPGTINQNKTHWFQRHKNILHQIVTCATRITIPPHS